jgi:hypothetical protein
MSKTIITLHFLNVLIGCLCIAILGLTTHSIVLSDRIDPLISKNIKDTGLSMLMWAGCGGIVDMLLFLCIFRTKPFHLNTVCTKMLFAVCRHELTNSRRLNPVLFGKTLLSSSLPLYLSGHWLFLSIRTLSTADRSRVSLAEMVVTWPMRDGLVMWALVVMRVHCAMSCRLLGTYSSRFWF